MTSRTPKRAAVEPPSPAPARVPGPSVPPVTDGPGTPSSRLLPVSGPRRAAAGIPSPVTGAARLDRGAAPARGRSPQTPAGGAAAELAPSAGSTGLAAMAAAMTEDRGRDSLDAHVRRLFRDLGLRAFHPRDSRRSEKGYPDWTIAGPNGVLFRELKTQRGRVTAEQQAWLDALTAAGMSAKVWRPADLLNGTVAAELAAFAGRRTAGGAA